MIRLSRLTDYGIVLMSYMAEHRERPINAAELAAAVQLPLPTVGKLRACWHAKSCSRRNAASRAVTPWRVRPRRFPSLPSFAHSKARSL